MADMRLGKSGIVTNKNGFGALPIQRISENEAVYLLQKARDNGITFFDTSRAYTDSEEKMGRAFRGARGKVVIATKSQAKTGEAFTRDLETSLKTLDTDYIDIMQFHNLPFCPKPGDGTGLFEAMLKARDGGKVLHIGITNHRFPVAEEAIVSDLYETLQFPFSYLAAEKDIALVRACEKADMGFIAMKSLSGGLIKNSAAAYAFAAQFNNVLPIWGIQRESELDEFISYMYNPPELTDEIKTVI
ncbi:MAG: aldo/keto reductase, partial [Oscillospiraceae bacterium]